MTSVLSQQAVQQPGKHTDVLAQIESRLAKNRAFYASIRDANEEIAEALPSKQLKQGGEAMPSRQLKQEGEAMPSRQLKQGGEALPSKQLKQGGEASVRPVSLNYLTVDTDFPSFLWLLGPERPPVEAARGGRHPRYFKRYKENHGIDLKASPRACREDLTRCEDSPWCKRVFCIGTPRYFC
jgi:hypothetical protein